MTAPVGNQFWKMRATSGPPRKYETPDELWIDCNKYFEERSELPEWNRQPWPFTISSLCIYLGITMKTWTMWRDEKHDLCNIVTRVDEIIRDQKLSGAMVGAYNSNIVARDLGLADKTDATVDVKGLKDFYASDPQSGS